MQTFHGSCHCGRVRFEIDVELERTSKCNCSFCWKQRNWNIPALKPEQFRLVTGEEDLGDYARTGERFETHHRFCRHCGTATHGHGFIEQAGGAYVGVRVAALDHLPVETLIALPVTYCDGFNDNWWNPPGETRHL